jgi:hypothetical protein
MAMHQLRVRLAITRADPGQSLRVLPLDADPALLS